MRIGEALGLRDEDLEIAERIVTVRPRHNDNGARVKAGVSRMSPASAELMPHHVPTRSRTVSSLTSIGASVPGPGDTA